MKTVQLTIEVPASQVQMFKDSLPFMAVKAKIKDTAVAVSKTKQKKEVAKTTQIPVGPPYKLPATLTKKQREKAEKILKKPGAQEFYDDMVEAFIEAKDIIEGRKEGTDAFEFLRELKEELANEDAQLAIQGNNV